MLRIAGENGQPAIAAAVILGGGLQPPPLAERSKRPVLDTLIRPGVSLLGAWVEKLDEIYGGFPADCVVVLSKEAREPSLDQAWKDRVRLYRDKDDYRGPAGSVRDAVEGLNADDWVLVIEGNRFCSGSLSGLVESHNKSQAQITVAHNDDTTPAGLYLLRRGTLDLVPPRGFMDLKEQWLGLAVRAGLEVMTHNLAPAASIAVRNLEDALKVVCLDQHGVQYRTDTITNPNPVVEGSPVVGQRSRWESVVSPGANVGLSAVITESIIMPDASVGEGALVARSLVMPGAKIDPGAEVLDDIVAPGEVRSPGMAAAARERSGRR